MRILIVVIVLLVVSIISIISTMSLHTNYLDEPTHSMTEGEMLQVCIEEGIPLDD